MASARPLSLLALLISVAFLVACGSDNGPSPTGPPEPGTEGAPKAAGVGTTDVATGLEVPWGIDFLPGGDALVTERMSGRVLRLAPGEEPEEVQELPSEARGEGGLLGIAVSPDYERDGYVYAYYTTNEDNRVVRFRLGEEPEPILTGIGAGEVHNGGQIKFGPDGMLYVATGDAGDFENSPSQDPESLNGKILRITPEGDVPDDNPVPGSPVYSLGHRNVQGLAWDAEGRLFATEFGQDRFDEVNLIEPGGNYGWPEVEGEGGEPEFIDPLTTWRPDQASPSGAEILLDPAVREWDGDMFVGALVGQRLWRLELDDRGGVAAREPLFTGSFGRIRTAVQAPDGSLWFTTSNRDGRGSPADGDDRIVRLGD